MANPRPWASWLHAWAGLSITCCGKSERLMPNASGTASLRSARSKPRSPPRNHDVRPRHHGAFCRHNDGRPKAKKAPEAWLDRRSQAPFGTPSSWVFLVRVHACRAGLRFPRRNDYRFGVRLKIRKNQTQVRDGPEAYQGGNLCKLPEARPARAVSVGA
jgi:hypothetical protein